MDQNNKVLIDEMKRKKFQLMLESNAQRMANIQRINKVIGDGASAFLSYGHKLREDTKKRQRNYFRRINEQLSQLPVQQGLDLLLSERSKLKRQLVIAEIDKDGFDRKYIGSLLQDVLGPLIEIQKEDIESNRLFVEELERTKEKEVVKIESNIEILESAFLIEPLPVGFKQIESTASKDEIINFFMRLFKSKNMTNNRPYMSKENVMRLVYRNFKIFEQKPSGGYIPLNLTERQKGKLRYFIYDFYSQYGGNKSKTKMQYVDFLIWNFELFKNDDRVNLNKSVNTTSKPKNDLI